MGKKKMIETDINFVRDVVMSRKEVNANTILEMCDELERVRQELETTKRHMAEDTRDIGALEDEVATLRAELTKAQEEKKEAESRIKELELALSGKTFSYDPDSYKKGVIAGMEEARKVNAAVISDYHGTPEETPVDSYTIWKVDHAIRARIEEVKNETNKA